MTEAGLPEMVTVGVPTFSRVPVNQIRLVERGVWNVGKADVIHAPALTASRVPINPPDR